MEFLLIGEPQHLFKLSSHSLPLTSDISLAPVHSAMNLDFKIDRNLSYHPLSKACLRDIRDRRGIQPHLDMETASTIAMVDLLVILNWIIAARFLLLFSRLNSVDSNSTKMLLAAW